MTNKMTDSNCMNCHNFRMNDPSDMVFHRRAGAGSGTYISVKNEWKKVNLKTEFNKGGAYPSWHPGGNKIAFSVNSLTMVYHSIGESRDVVDRNSDLAPRLSNRLFPLVVAFVRVLKIKLLPLVSCKSIKGLKPRR